MNKEDFLEALVKLERETAELRAKIEAEGRPPQVGRLCFVSDSNQLCSSKYSDLALIVGVGEYEGTRMFMSQTDCPWLYARIATWPELGVPWVEDMEKLVEELAADRYIYSQLAQERAKRIIALRDEATGGVRR